MRFPQDLETVVADMRRLGVLRLKDGEQEIELFEQETPNPFDLRVMPEPGLMADETPTSVTDPTLCAQCQERPKDRNMVDKNLCRPCALKSAGVVL